MGGLAAVGGLGWVVLGSDLMRLHTVRVVGNQHVSEIAVRHLADLPSGEPLLTLDLAHTVEQIEQHPWVAHAEVRREFPDAVVIRVEERQVKALLLLDGLYMVDAEGEVFRRADPGAVSWPILTGVSAELAEAQPAVARRLIREGLELLEVAAAHHLPPDTISEVRFDRGSGYTLALRNGGEVLVGFDGPLLLPRLDALATAGLDLSLPHRIDLGPSKLAVVTPLSSPL